MIWKYVQCCKSTSGASISYFSWKIKWITKDWNAIWFLFCLFFFFSRFKENRQLKSHSHFLGSNEMKMKLHANEGKKTRYKERSRSLEFEWHQHNGKKTITEKSIWKIVWFSWKLTFNRLSSSFFLSFVLRGSLLLLA